MGGILGQSVRVLVAALAKVVTPLEFHHCIWIIGLFVSANPMGMRCYLDGCDAVFPLLVRAFLVYFGLLKTEGGWSQMIQVAGDADKFTLLISLPIRCWVHPVVTIIAVPFQNRYIWGRSTQCRMFCCRDAEDARKAMIASSSLILTLLMLLVGAALFAYYEPMRIDGTNRKFSQVTPIVFPVWIVTER